jgi:hypothetical protein
VGRPEALLVEGALREIEALLATPLTVAADDLLRETDRAYVKEQREAGGLDNSLSS